MATLRHRWIASRVADVFGLDVDTVSTSLQSRDAAAEFDRLLDGSGPAALYVYYQPRDVRGPDGTVSPGAGPSQLIVHTGAASKLRGRAVWFLRQADGEVDLSKIGDAALLSGEIGSNLLESLSTELSAVFEPTFRDQSDWGKASAEQPVEFRADMSRTVASVDEAIRGMGTGVTLGKPSKETDLDVALRQATAGTGPSADVIRTFEGLVEGWCTQITRYLNEPPKEEVSRDKLPGPRAVLEHWRVRMTRLTSITEQLKTKECKNVLAVLASVTKSDRTDDTVRQSLFALLRKWKQVDIAITEGANEAKDNVKYLFTLEKFIEPLYLGDPVSIVDTLPALMNSIKMIHTIARYFNTTERMEDLFSKVTYQMINSCKAYILSVQAEETGSRLWEKDPQTLIAHMEACLKLNVAYQEQYRLTKERLESATPKGKLFDFNERTIFGKFDLFCRRVVKLIDMFSTIQQFTQLALHKLEGMDDIIGMFFALIDGFKRKRHDLLDFQRNDFDRDYVEFNSRINELEGKLQQFINASFESISSIEHSLNLLKKFQEILQRETLRADLDDKFNIIFQTYGGELESVQALYERNKHAPPVPRNLPPVAGAVTWSRHLLKRIEEPMKRFEENQNVLASKDAKRIVKTYNKVARTLVAFEYLWYQAWLQSIETAKAGLQATLIIRHPDDGKLYVNFDHELLQLIREAKCLDRMGIEIPESAKIVLLQEDKFKSYFNDLSYALKEYSRIVQMIIPVTAPLLKPHIADMEYRLRPGMVTLTWTSMNIDAYKHHVFTGLRRLEELVTTINDIVENRIEKNLKVVSKALLVDLPIDRSFTLDDFVRCQQEHIRAQAVLLQGKNQEIEVAVEDLLHAIMSYPLDAHIEAVSPDDAEKLRVHYNHFMFQALLHCSKNSLNALKKRVASKQESTFIFVERPFFEVDVQLAVPNVRLSPDPQEVQEAMNKCAVAVLSCNKRVWDWGQSGVSEEERLSFYPRVTADIEIARVILLLTGSIQGTKNQVNDYLSTFTVYDWLWKENADAAYAKFMKTSPELDDYERELMKFDAMDQEIEALPPLHNVGALSLNTHNIKGQLKKECGDWKIKFSDNLHKRASEAMAVLADYMKSSASKLRRQIVDIDSLRFVMNVLKDIRERESGISMEINPVLDMYAMLEFYLPEGYIAQQELDEKSMLKNNWRKLVELAESVTDEISKLQGGFKKKLLADVKSFVVDVVNFRADYVANGPMVKGIAPQEAMERLRRYQDEFELRARKYELYSGGEELFALKKTEYPELENTRKEIELLQKLYGLYRDVMNKMNDWKTILWSHVVANVGDMTTEMENFAGRCKKLPKKLREWEAYNDLKKQIEDTQTVLPLLQELSKPSLRDRHWEEIATLTGHQMNVHDPEFRLADMLSANLVAHQVEIEEICDGADKQLDIENKLNLLREKWEREQFYFQDWKGRGVSILMGVSVIIENLEEDQMLLQTMLTMRHVVPFREDATAKLKELSDTSETLELWLKVQMLWCSLESVFLGGDIARQMPVVAKKFVKIDKDWAGIMKKAVDTQKIVESASNDILRSNLPAMHAELEKCQKNLEGYLEQKRNKFPRFYFVSNPVLLLMLSQGSDPLAVQAYYEKIFDSITMVEHDRKDKTIIREMINRDCGSEERIPFHKPVKAVGNIEEWLMDLLNEQQRTMKNLCRDCAADVISASGNLDNMRSFVDSSCAQYALLGIQLMWTMDMQAALESCKTKKNAMRDANQKTLNVLSKLSSWCLQDLGSALNRKKIETLVTIQVHQRDVSNDLFNLFKAKKIQTADDFEWLKQARFFWRPDDADSVNDDGSCRIWVTDVEFTYQYEYLGTKERLVTTPLTDRCYVTLAQAVGMYFGGAPAGPAGTGKTETVKDMGRAMGIYVVVTNCSTEMRYTDCAKIFKGLCQSGLWGCFDEFNRIELPVLSVVAQQVLAVSNARKINAHSFQFPGDPQDVSLNPACGFFITMNPPVKGYTGRQELPENLKALFRGVAMMVPDFEIIIKVKLCSVGYTDFTMLAKKFFICYALCKEQLSQQRHYDFGLRNILSVLRTAGQTKRDNLSKSEDELLFRTLRDMNLSKFVAQDVPLFLSMLKDVFPTVPAPPKAEHPAVEEQIAIAVDGAKLVRHETWMGKVVQLYETWLVRHGIMITGASGGGKSQIFNMLSLALQAVKGQPFKIVRANPKAFTSQEMFGETDAMTGEWTTGVLSAMWEKYNNRNLPYNTWFILDGPVDAVWIESMNTVLDDNKILTLASGDRIPMTENTKIMFENENLENASPATVSRCGIVYLSDTELDWAPVVEAWIRKQAPELQSSLRALFLKYFGENTPAEFGHLFDYIIRYVEEIMSLSRVSRACNTYTLLGSILHRVFGTSMASPSSAPDLFQSQLEKLFIYAMVWAVGGALEPESRVKLDQYVRKRAPDGAMPTLISEEDSVFDYYVDETSFTWKKWRPPTWTCPTAEKLDFSNLLVPTMDSTRALFLLDTLHNGVYKMPVLLIGGPGTAKTSTCLMFFDTFDGDVQLLKRINFSAFTTPAIFQATMDGELDKRSGKSFGPPNNKRMTVFIDDIAMPTINKWGDQPTNEIVRQLIEQKGYYFLEKDKRGDFKYCEDIFHIAAMAHPTSGRNDVPNRLKRQHFIFNMILPSVASIDDLYGQMIRGRFTRSEFGSATMSVVDKLTTATIELWRQTKARMLPTPAKFHYIFNMRDLSRVFQGIFLTPKDTILTGGQQTPTKDGALIIVQLWKHECNRVLQDKLTTKEDKAWFATTLERVTESNFGSDLADKAREEAVFVDFFRDDVYDDDDVFVEYGPKLYEPGGTLANVKDRVEMYMAKQNTDFPATPLQLVLFEDALRHLIRISRIIQMPRGSALLVGVGGSGKQSLTRLAAYIARSRLFQIKLTKSYNVAALFEDLRGLYKDAGQAQKSVTFLFTDAEIKDEAFLEYINSVLLTGEIVGLFAKDEYMSMSADLRNAFIKARPGQPDSPDNLKRFFIDTVRDNLHVVLCMSPVNPRFPIRARMFPGLISCCTIDWFLPWPQAALVNVADGLLRTFPMEATEAVKDGVIRHMGTVHQLAGDVCTEYYSKNRRRVYQTPKSYLAFIHNYKHTYKLKLAQLKTKEASVNLGLQKLIKGAEDVEAMKIVLAAEQVKLDKATKETNAMLGSLEISSKEAQTESKQVAKIKSGCEAEAARIGEEKAQCQADLAKAQPFLDEANTAIESIKPAHINEVKKLPKPADIIRLVFDGVLVLFMSRMDPPNVAPLVMNKKEFEFLGPSWAAALSVMADTQFLKRIQEFEKEKMNEETIELLSPYIDLEDFNPKVAKAASAAAEGLCTWVRAMKFYHGASKIVKPKLEALAVAEGKLEVALKALQDAENRLAACNARLKELKDAFDAQMAEKKKIEDGAMMLQRKMEQASKLINGLSGERIRWTEDSANFADTKRRLVGDCAVACAFISYCGPFNQEFRKYLINDKFIADCKSQGVPVTMDLDVVSLLVDVGTIGDWNLQGLPTDPLSIQNGILVTQAARFPLLIDPQGQAITWIKNREKSNMPLFGVTLMNNPQLKDQLEFCMQEGRSLVVAGVEQDIDPLLDPVLEKQVITKGRRKYINIADKMVELHDDFRMFFITRLPNPHFSPELQAKTTVVDFTVTMKGLEEQLLGRVIAKEQKALEDLLNKVLEEVNSNTKALLLLDAQLLERLSANSGNLLDDEELIDVLAGTKQKAAEVKEKLSAAAETRRSINDKREQFRPVATRGSVLYFSIVDMSMVNVMYQTSLAQFTELFMRSMDDAEKASLPAKRVQKIIECMTYLVYRYVNKGLYEVDKLLFLFILTVKIMTTAGLLDPAEVTTFQRGGAALDINSVRKKPKWMIDDAWLNVIELSTQSAFFKSLPDNIIRGNDAWKAYYEENEPENVPIPDFELAIADNKETGSWLKLLLLRCIRLDRTLLVMKDFIKRNEAMGERYTEPVSDTIEMIFNDMTAQVPVIFLLSAGADPTDSIVQFARKKKQSVTCVSLGQGQEPVAMKAINAAAVNGSWVLLQNCELGLPLMDQMEEILLGMKDTVNADFRLFITCLPHPKFPLGLLQMCTKITNEPPQGIRAGLSRSYNVMVDQDKLERIDQKPWRQLLYAMCFMHTIVVERRKFGSLGWCQHYDFNNGDLGASMMFLEKHMYAGPISWPTLQYMVTEVQYGGKVTDNLDRRMFNTYGSLWVAPRVLADGFSYNPGELITKFPNDFNYTMFDSLEIDAYRKWASSFPEIDSPEIFGLHPNADLTYRVKEVESLLRTFSETQPRQASGGSGKSLETIVTEIADDLLARLPEDYVEEDYRVKIRKLGGMEVPLNIFLYQEIQRLQKVISKVRSMLIAMQQAIRGEVVMTQELVEAMGDVFDAKVPNSWIWTPGADEFSWVLPKLGLWFASLLERDTQYRTWLTNGRPLTFWLTGFFNPQGFLTAMKQEVTRLHKAQQWALDEVAYYTEVTDQERADSVRAPPKEGAYIHGLFLDAAAWSKSDNSLIESVPKKLFANLPILLVSAMTQAMLKQKREMFGVNGPYECPCYKYAERTDRYFIFYVNLATRVQKPVHWILRGTALLCSISSS